MYLCYIYFLGYYLLQTQLLIVQVSVIIPVLLAVSVLYLFPWLLSVTDSATDSTDGRHNACTARCICVTFISVVIICYRLSY